MNATVTRVVGPEHTAQAVGSGDLEVLGTPVVLAWMEEATCAMLELDAGQTSVGTHIEVRHLVASRIGATITAIATLTGQDGRVRHLQVTAHDEHHTLVAQGQIYRLVVDRDRFLSRVPDVGPSQK